MKNNKPLLAIFFTIIAEIPIELFTQLMKHFHLTNISGLEAMSMPWMPEGNWFLGILGGLGIGSWIGIIIYYSAKIWGTDYFPIKSLLLSMTTQALVFCIFGVLGRNLNLIQNASGNFVHAFASGFGGLLAGYLIKKYLYRNCT